MDEFDRWQVHCADEVTVSADDISVVITQQVWALPLQRCSTRQDGPSSIIATELTSRCAACSLGACDPTQWGLALAYGPARSTCSATYVRARSIFGCRHADLSHMCSRPLSPTVRLAMSLS